MLKLSHPTVIIFGAGATHGCFEKIDDTFVPPPTDAYFFQCLNLIKGRGTPILAKKVLRSVWDIYGKIYGIGLEQYYRDIESRAVIGGFAKTANKPKDWNKRKDELEELIRRVYIHTSCKIEKEHFKPKVSTPHKNILANLKKGDTLITFNYDLVIEESFSDSKLWNPVDGYGVDVSGKNFDWCRQWLKNHGGQGTTQESNVHLLKLHGSLNWDIYNNQQIKLKARPYLVKTKGRKPSLGTISILPPGWNKRIDKNPYKKFWKQARTKLENCKSLVILGYSLPETDLLAQALFAEIVRQRVAKRKYLKFICLADPTQEIKEKFLNLFKPILSAQSNIFLYDDINHFATTIKTK